MKKLCFTSFCAALLAAQIFAQTPGTTAWPHYNEVVPGQWTMNYDGALEASKNDGRDVMVYFSGDWCPDCKNFGRNVLLTPLWNAAVADSYLVLLDFERRNGGDEAFLYDAAYAAYAGVSPSEALDRMRYNYELQDYYEINHVKRGRGANQSAILTKYGIPNTWRTLWYPTVVVLRGNAGSDPQFVGSFREVEVGINNNAATVPGSAKAAVDFLNDWCGRSITFTNPGENKFNLMAGVSAVATIPISNTIGGTPGAHVVSGSLPSGFTVAVEGGNVVIRGTSAKEGVYTFAIGLFASLPNNGAPDTEFIGQTLGVTLEFAGFASVNPSLPGAYTAWLANADGTVSGLVTATVSSRGRLSLRVNLGGGLASSYTGGWSEVSGNEFRIAGPIQRGRAEVDLFFDGSRVRGTVASAGVEYEVNGGRNIAKPATGYAGYYTLVIPPNAAGTVTPPGVFANVPEGYGYLTVTVAASGSARYSGRLADGTALSGSAALVWDDGTAAFVLPVYRVLYSKAGGFGARAVLQPGATPAQNTVSLAGAGWWFKGRAARNFQDGFTMLNMDAVNVGGWYDKKINLAAAYLGQYGFTVENPGFAWKSGAELIPLDASRLPDNLGFVASGSSGSIKFDANNAKATFNVNRTSGVINGKFNLVYGSPARKTISVPWRGVLVPQGGALGGAGYFLQSDNTLDKPFDKVKQSFPVFVEQ